jgi:hypothetical protein
MSLLNAYNQILNEGKGSQEVKGSTLKQGQDFASDFSVTKQDGPKVDAPKEDTKNSVGKSNDGKPSKAKEYKESSNPFDAYFQSILENEGWEAEEEANEQPDFGGSEGPSEISFNGDVESGEGELEPEEEGGHPMAQVLDALRAAVEALEKVVGHEEEEEGVEEESEEEESEEAPEETEDFPESEDSTSEDTMGEEVDAEELGHALVDLEKLAASLTNPKSQVVKGAVPVAKGKAQVPKGTKADGKLSELKGRGENLEAKKNDTGYVKKDKNWYDQ